VETRHQLLDGQLAGRDLCEDLALIIVPEQEVGSGNPLDSQDKPAVNAVAISFGSSADKARRSN
jgi:hypothetical protein